ncbi:30S ribosomal protein S16 [symbiont of Argiope bruennichi]|uniref:30S ribosomal protein S16 n=1 Tax=symbiont of Argiope bruennichi TaxID=2810479 RepID=UPI003DA1CE3F
MVKIRLTRFGKKKFPHYRIVAVDSKQKAKCFNYLENLGNYNPASKELVLNENLCVKWLLVGAQPSETVKNLFKQKKIFELYLKQKQNKNL